MSREELSVLAAGMHAKGAGGERNDKAGPQAIPVQYHCFDYIPVPVQIKDTIEGVAFTGYIQILRESYSLRSH